MLADKIYVPSAGGYQLLVEAYVPEPNQFVDPDIQRAAVVICPGGGYNHWGERETEPVALRFMAHGFNCFVVRYRFSPNLFPIPQQDAASAVAYIRKNARALHTHPDKIALMGFSAGGHLAASLGAMWEKTELWQEMGLTPEDVKPNALVIGYGVMGLEDKASRYCHYMLTGSENLEDHKRVSVICNMSASCPPAFLWSTFDDQTVPIENTLLMAGKLSEFNIPAEVHIFPEGPHGSSLANEMCAGVVNPQYNLPYVAGWPEMAVKFLNKML